MLKTIKDINLKNKRVLVRVDYNVTLQVGRIADDLRLRQTLATIKYLSKQNCRIILMSHLDDPGGRYVTSLSLKPVAKDLQKLLNKKICLAKNYLSVEDQKKIAQKNKRNIILLENLRFNPGEETNDLILARQLANLGEIFVQDGFGVCHRRHVSVLGVPKFLPAVAGLLLAKEITVISHALTNPQLPMLAIVGGAKTATKIKLLDKLMEKSQIILLGGVIANTFLKAKGFNVGQSKVDVQALSLAAELLAKAKKKQVEFILPADAVVADSLSDNFINNFPIAKIPPNGEIVDIGPQTEALFSKYINLAKTIIWNGPMGLVEKPEFSRGTEFIFYAIAQNSHAVSIVGGGDTIAKISKEEYLEKITHLSTGGGAMLEFIEKGTLPGIKVLPNK